MDSIQLRLLVEKLALPKGEYVIFGGGCLAIRDLRTTTDLDLFTSQSLYDNLKSTYGGELHQYGQTYLVFSKEGIEIEVHASWNMMDWPPDFEEYLQRPEIIMGLPFMPLDKLYEWKNAVRRPKDISDIVLIENYWNSVKGQRILQ